MGLQTSVTARSKNAMENPGLIVAGIEALDPRRKTAADWPRRSPRRSTTSGHADGGGPGHQALRVR